MSKKIVITGALGYIGTELCKLYSGESRHNKILAIDTRFVSQRVKELNDYGIEFTQCSILDKDKLGELLHDADVVHHLAGITDVAYTKTESNPEWDEEIRKTAVVGTQNVLDVVSEACKIIFPSTHVVFEGVTSTKENIKEEEVPCPVLTYAKSKYVSEQDLANQKNPYVILRLGSVYGYSNDTMRIGIMPNLFSKMAAQKQTIKLFGKGVQLKSLVSILDVARCFKFMEQRDDIKNEIFHLVNEKMSVRDVADIVTELSSIPVTKIDTDDEIPNLGYTLDNSKLLKVGFTFLYDIKTAIKEMLENWSLKNNDGLLTYTINSCDEYEDERGKIENYYLPEKINLIGLIESKKNSVRGNHYHPVQEQKCLLLKGKYISCTKDIFDEDAAINISIVEEGSISVIKPNVAHAMIFLENSILLNLVNGERLHDNYGITHTIPYEIVDNDIKNNLLKNNNF